MKSVTFLAVSGLLACGRGGFDLVPTGDGSSGEGDNDGSVGDDGGGSLGDDGSTGAPDAPGTAMIVGTSFTTFAPAQQPTARRSSGAALKTAAPEELWIYGGYNGAFLGDLAVYTPSTGLWSAPAVSGTAPGLRERHSLAWDPVDNALVVFGGQNRPVINLVHYDTLHVINGTGWVQIPKAGNWPAARKDATLVWIPHLSQFLLYGGNNGTMASNRYDDLWLLTLDASAGTGSWASLAPLGVTPPKQSAGCVVYAPQGHRLILFGGETADSVDNNNVYQYLLDTNEWQLDAPTGPIPSGESFQQCAWDDTHKRVLVYGGQANGGNPIGGHAIYDPYNQVWSAPSPSSNPGVRSDGGAVYSPALGGMLWYGGRTGATSYTSDVVLMKLDVQ